MYHINPFYRKSHLHFNVVILGRSPGNSDDHFEWFVPRLPAAPMLKKGKIFLKKKIKSLEGKFDEKTKIPPFKTLKNDFTHTKRPCGKTHNK